MKEYDFVIIGGGCAGLSLAYELDIHNKLDDKKLAIIEPRDEYKRDKTWSFWKVNDHNFNDCIKNSDAVVILTEWNEFRSLSPQRLKEHMKGNILIDLRNALNQDSFRESGFNLIQVGRPNIPSQ